MHKCRVIVSKFLLTVLGSLPHNWRVSENGRLENRFLTNGERNDRFQLLSGGLRTGPLSSNLPNRVFPTTERSFVPLADWLPNSRLCHAAATTGNSLRRVVRRSAPRNGRYLLSATGRVMRGRVQSYTLSATQVREPRESCRFHHSGKIRSTEAEDYG